MTSAATVEHLESEHLAGYRALGEHLYRTHMEGVGRPGGSPYPFEQLPPTVQANWCRVAKAAESWIVKAGEWARLPAVESGDCGG